MTRSVVPQPVIFHPHGKVPSSNNIQKILNRYCYNSLPAFRKKRSYSFFSAGAVQMDIKVSSFIVRYLERLGTEYIFGIPGAHILPVYDALLDSPIRPILTKH